MQILFQDKFLPMRKNDQFFHNAFHANVHSVSKDSLSLSTRSPLTFGSNSTAGKASLIGNQICLPNGEKLSISPCSEVDIPAAIAFVIKVNAQENGYSGLRYWLSAQLEPAIVDFEESVSSSRGICYLVKDHHGRIDALVSALPYRGESYDSVIPESSKFSKFRGKQNAETTEAAEIGDFYVDERLWNQGVGRALLGHLEKQLDRLGYTSMILSSNDRHTVGHKAYRKLNFSELGQYSSDGNTYSVFMKEI